ncbi:Uncharacterised protein [uncultured Clostridium sp.]|nr:Uncharacterised protein [uncultured Clostridium sp.]
MSHFTNKIRSKAYFTYNNILDNIIEKTSAAVISKASSFIISNFTIENKYDFNDICESSIIMPLKIIEQHFGNKNLTKNIYTDYYGDEHFKSRVSYTEYFPNIKSFMTVYYRPTDKEDTLSIFFWGKKPKELKKFFDHLICKANSLTEDISPAQSKILAYSIDADRTGTVSWILKGSVSVKTWDKIFIENDIYNSIVNYIESFKKAEMLFNKMEVTYKLGSIFIMTKTLLIPNHTSYILCGVGSQSVELFTKIEKFVMRQIPSFATLTDVYQGEVVKSVANTNGFVHNPASYHFGLYNGSEVFTLNGNFDNNRSKRSNLNFYDEAAFVGNEELFTTSEPFCTQNSKFKLGQGLSDDQLKSEPHPFNNQLIYASSAGRTDQYFFKKYREASLHMAAGDKRYFVADINSDMVIHATKHGIVLTEALLTQETIDSRMREDKEAGLREYGNIFTSEGGDGQIIRRADVIRNSYPYAPVLNSKGEHKYKKFGITYDPARSHDNSVVTVAGFYEDSRGIWNADLVNMISLADLMKKNKTPMSTPNQIKALKGIIADYVPPEDLSYDTLAYIFVDAGSGGAGVPITDFLCEDWVDKNGNKRRGLIDPEYNEGDQKKFPNAVKDKLRLISPSKFKSEMFEAMIKMIDTKTLHFTEEYMNKGSIELIYEIDAKGRAKQRMTYPSEEEEEELAKKNCQVTTETYHLMSKEELALKQIDMAKTELVNIYRFKQSSGKDRFDLAPEKANKMHKGCCACAA